jgi:hypothetical protein
MHSSHVGPVPHIHEREASPRHCRGYLAYCMRLMVVPLLASIATACATADPPAAEQPLAENQSGTQNSKEPRGVEDILLRQKMQQEQRTEGAYSSALYQLAIVMTSFDAASTAQRTHERLVEMALTIIVGARERRRAPPSPPALPRPPLSQPI